MHPSLTQLQHRPWPLPETRWQWRQSWNDLLFIHYKLTRESAAGIAKRLPSRLKLQEFDGETWVGLVPFQMNGVMKRPFPNLPWFSNFLELNVRLYVECDGKPGVWFLSLDATNPIVVWAGNHLFYLPYRNARIKRTEADGFTRYHSVRRSKTDPFEFDVRFRPMSEVFFAKPGTLEFFLTERYCFYAQGPRGLYRADVHHWPWPLQQAEGAVLNSSRLDVLGVDSTSEPRLLYSKGVDVASWTPARLSAGQL